MTCGPGEDRCAPGCSPAALTNGQTAAQLTRNLVVATASEALNPCLEKIHDDCRELLTRRYHEERSTDCKAIRRATVVRPADILRAGFQQIPKTLSNH